MANQRFLLTAQLKLAAPNNIRQIVNQINAGLQGVRANVSINTGGLNQQLSTVTRTLGTTSKAAKQAANDMELLGENAAIAIRKYGAFAVTTSSFLKFISSVQAGVKDAIEFDREIVRIAQVTGNSISVVKELGDEVTRLSKKFGASSSEVLSTAVTLSQAGLSAKEVKAALETLAKTTVSATFTDIKNTTEASIAIMQQFGKSTSDLEKIFSSINAVSAKFAVESEDIAKAVRLAGAAFQASGGSLEEFEALFTSVRQTTRESAESIATGLRTIFTRLQRPRTQNFLSTLGIDLKDADGAFVGPYKAIQRLNEALKDISGTDPRFAQIAEELGGYRQISKTIPLIQKFDISQQALNVALRSGNSLTRDSEIGQEALAIQIAKVREEFLSLIRVVTNSDAFRGILDTTLQLTKAMISLVSATEPLLPILVALGSFKAFDSIASFGKGFSKKIGGKSSGGVIRAFASGGVVPGHGSGDTVPAMLTPGEFVIRKKAVEAIGTDTLDGINRYASGGKISRRDKREYRKRLYNRKSLLNLDVDSGFNNANEAIFNKLIYGKDLYTNESVSHYINSSTANLNSYLAKGKLYNTKDELFEYRYDIGNRINDILKKYNIQGLPDPAFINLTNDVYKSISDEDKDKIYSLISDYHKSRYLDYLPDKRESFAKGLIKQKVLKIRKLINRNKFDNNIILWSALDINSRKSAESQTDGFKINKTFAIPRFLSTSTTSPSSSLFAQSFFRGEKKGDGVYLKIRNFKGQSGLPIVVFDDYSKERTIDIKNKKGDIVNKVVNTRHFDNGEQEVLLPNRSLFRVSGPIISRPGNIDEGRLPYRIVPVDRLAKGGYSSSDTDTVPALLTPGEFVINKKAASKLGSKKLNELNNADKVQKFAMGGSVQRFALGGSPKSSGLSDFISSPFGILGILTTIEAFGSSLSEAESTFGKLISIITQTAFQFGLLNTVSKTVTQELPRGIRASITGERTPKDKADEILLRNYLGGGPQAAKQAKKEVAERVARRESRAAFIQSGLGIAGAIGSIGGSLISDSARKDISEGKSSAVNTFAAGSALSSAGIGASIGSALGPFGAALGASIGAIYGWTTGLKKATDEINKVNFAKRLESFGRTLDKFVAGRLSVNNSRASIIDFVNSTAGSLSSANSKDIKADFANQATKVEIFINKLASESKSFDELTTKTGNLIVNFARLADIPFSQLKKEIEDQIDRSQNAAKFNKNFEDMAEAENRNVILLSALSDAINRVTLSLNQYDSELENAKSFLSGSGGSFKSLDFNSVLSRADKIGFNNTDLVAKFGQSTFGQLGSEGENATRILTETTQAISELPLILLEAKRKTGLGTGENEFIESLKTILTDRGFNSDVSGKILSGARGVIGSELKDERIIAAINENLEGVVNEIAKPMSNIIDISSKFADQFRQQTERIKSAFEIYTEAQVKATGISLQISDKFEAVPSLIEEITGKLRPSAGVFAREQDQIFALGGARTPIGLQTRLNRFQEIASSASRAASQTLDINEQEKFNRQLADANIGIKLVTSALEKLANSSSTLSQIQKEIAAEEEKRKFKEGLTLAAIFGSKDAKKTLNKQAAFTSLAIERGIDFIPEEERTGVLDFLQSAGKQKIKGTPANEIIKKLAKNSIVGRSIGSDIVEENLTPGSGANIKSLVSDFQLIIKQQQQALSALRDNALKIGDDAAKSIGNENKKFLDDLRKIFNDNLIASKNTEISAVKAQKGVFEGKRNAVNRLSGLSGAAFVQVNDSNIADVFGARDNLQLLSDSIKKRSELSNPFVFTSSSRDKNTLIERAKEYAYKRGIELKDEDLLGLSIGKRREERTSMADGTPINELVDYNLSSAGAELSPQEKAKFSNNVNRLLFSKNKDALTKANIDVQSNVDKVRSTSFGIGISNTIGEDQKKIDETIKELSRNLTTLGSDSISSLTTSIDNLSTKISELELARDNIGRASGGYIPGVGNSDTVPAMLTPGEFVIRKSAVEAIGLSNLYALNNNYASGGKVRRKGISGGYYPFDITTRPESVHREFQSLISSDIEIDDAIRKSRPLSERIKEAKRNILEKKNQDEDKLNKFFAAKQAREEILNKLRENRQTINNKANVSSSKGTVSKFSYPLNKLTYEESKSRRDKLLAKITNEREERGDSTKIKSYSNIVPSNESNGDYAERYFAAKQAREELLAKKGLQAGSYSKNIPKSVSKDTLIYNKTKKDFEDRTFNKYNHTDLAYDIIAKRKANIQSIKQARADRISEIKNQKQILRDAYRKRTNRYASGGVVDVGGGVSIGGLSELQSVVQKFSTVVGDMSSKLDSFRDLSISLNANHKVEVIFNGAEVLTKLQPEITKIAVEQAKVAINSMIDSKFPEVGRV